MSTLACASLVDSATTVRENSRAAEVDAFLSTHAEASSYHRRAWLDVIGRAFGHRTAYLTAERDGAIVGALPMVFFDSRVFGRFSVSMPFLNYGGIIADDATAAQALLTRAIEITRAHGGTHLELRHTRQQFPALAAKRHKVAMELALAATPDAQWQALDKKVRNQVRKAEKAGIQVVVGAGELLADFYAVFSRNMRDLGTPVYGRHFFEQVLTAFPDESRVLVGYLSGQPVAASLVHWHGTTLEVPWASSLREFNPLCANVLLYWEMLRFATGRGFQTFDFGRSTPGEGTFHFKKQWGAVPRELVWEYWTADGHQLPELNPHNPKFSLAIRAWQRLPVAVATRIGPAIVRNIP